MSTDVTLAALATARFPDRCILCGCRGPGKSLEVSTHTSSPLWKLLGGTSERRRAFVPACAFCRQLLMRQSKIRGIGLVIATISAAALYATLLFLYEGPYVTYMRTGGLLMFFMPYVVWEGLFPLPFRLSASRNYSRYCFEEKTYALEFALLNLPSDDPFFIELAEEEEDAYV